MSLATTYRPSTWDDVTEQHVVVEILKKMCEDKSMPNRNFLFIGPAGCGKAQPLYSKVLTPTGFIPMRSVQVGTEVLTGNGNVAEVSGVYPQGVRPIYEIVLQDRTRIRVSDEHLNVVYRYNDDKKCRQDYCLTTVELIKLLESSKFKLRIDVPCVDWDEQDVPIDPYLLGILLADGSLCGNFQLSNPESDICEKVDAKLRDIGYHLNSSQLDHDILLLRDDSGNVLHKTDKNLKQLLNDYGLLVASKSKYIPRDYLYNSRRVRLELLQGLFDGDGHIHRNGAVEYTTSSERLSDDFAFLVRSLGIRDTVCAAASSYKDASGKRIDCGIAYTHHLKVPNGLKFYSSHKHSARYRDRQNDPIRNIVRIDYIGMEECQCIMIDHPDHTYISDGFIPTHNTTLARIVGNVLNKGQGEPIEIDAASNSGVDAMRDIIQQARAYPVGCDWKVFILDECHSISNAGWQVLLKTLESGAGKSIFMFCTTNPEKIPATIISRVQTFQLSKISLDGIYNRLTYVLDSEIQKGRNISYTQDAVRFIAKLANGGMRDSLTLLDKALVYSNELTTEHIVDALNLSSYDDYFALLAACAKRDNSSIVKTIDSVYNSGVNFVKWFEGFHSFVMNVVKYILLQDIEATVIPPHYGDKMAAYGTAHLSVCLKLSTRLLTMIHDLKTTQYLQEVAMTHLCLPVKKGQ